MVRVLSSDTPIKFLHAYDWQQKIRVAHGYEF